MRVTQLSWKWQRPEAHTSRLAPLLTFPEHSVLDAPMVRCDFLIAVSIPMPAYFTSAYRGSISFLCTIKGSTFVPQHAQLWSPSLIASRSERRKPVHFRCLSLLQLLQAACRSPFRILRLHTSHVEYPTVVARV